MWLLKRLPLVWLVSLVFLGLRAGVASAQTPSPEQIDLGARLFADNCAVCHGSDGQGRVGATLSKDWPSLRPDLLVRSTIESGIPGGPMIAWSQANGGPLSDADIDALVAYILSWQTGGFPTIPPTATPYPRPLLTAVPDVEGDPNNGAVLYDQNCAVCHGPNGEGRVGATLSKAWPALRPDLSMKTTISNGIPGSPMPAWSQAKGGPLADSEINDVVAFLLALPSTEAQHPTPTPEPVPNAFFTDWGGVVLAVVLFIVLVSLAIFAQTRRKPES
jgi:cytochrome c oxidase cbb3-type subunit 3